MYGKIINNKLACGKCSKGRFECGDCKKSFIDEADGAFIYTEIDREWKCRKCILKEFEFFQQEPEETKWQICSVTFEEVFTEPKRIKFKECNFSEDDRNSIIREVRTFLRKLDYGRWNEALEMTSYSLRSSLTPVQLANQAKIMKIDSYSSSEWDVSIKKDKADVKGYLINFNKEKIPLHFCLYSYFQYPIGDVWRITGFGKDLS